MKKIISLVLVLVLILGLSACGKADTVGSAVGHHIPELHVSARGKLNGGIASVGKSAADHITRFDPVIIGIKLH